MNFFGLQFPRRKSAASASPIFNSVPTSWLGNVLEPFAGAWQKNITADARQNLLAFSAVYACVSLIADDIAKLRVKLVEQDGNGIWAEVDRDSPYWGVLRKPNNYQTRIQFLSQWMTSKLLHGNTYVYKERADLRGIPTALYCIDPRRVKPLVDDEGGIWYELQASPLEGITQNVRVPASEIIHDRCVTLFHPLIGVSPIYACGASATQGIRIQANSATFFENMSLPSGMLSAPAKIDDVTARRLKTDFESRFRGGGLGRLFVAGDGLKYEAFTMPAADAQLIEQLRWTVEDVARTFRVPLHKIASGSDAKFANMGALNQDYYAQTLQSHIESIELLLDEGLGLVDVDGRTYGTELDLEGLLRMDPLGRADRLAKLSGVMTVDEKRHSENLGPTAGGNAVYLQQQDFSTAALAKRDAKEDPFAAAKTTPAPADPVAVAANEPDATAAKFLAEFMDDIAKGLETCPT